MSLSATTTLQTTKESTMTSVRLRHNSAQPRDRQKERVHRMTQVIQSFASGFTLRPITVKLVQGGQAPAFSSSDRIWFHEGKIADLSTKQGVASLKGLTLHEISHILLSPRVGTEFRDWVIEQKLHRAWNSLEDQRIETHLIALYPSIKDWFEATMAEYLLKYPQQWSVAFPLIHGRKYLDLKVRGIVRKAFKHQERVDDLARIIDAYRTLNLTDEADIETAKVLVAEYHDLTSDLKMDNPHGHDVRSETEHETSVKSRPMPKKKQTEASDKVKNEEPEDDFDDSIYDDFDWDSLDDEDESDDEPDTNTDEPTGDDESDDEGESDDEWDGSDWDDDSDDPADSDTSDADVNRSPESDGGESESDPSEPNSPESLDSKGGKGAGGGAQKELERVLNEALDKTLERLGDKIANDIDLYNGDVLLEGEVLPEPNRYPHQPTRNVSKEAVEASEKFAYELKRLRAEHDPAWNRRVENGRINPVRWEQGCDLEEAFDRFEMGRSDATDIETVILLDVSGSMSTNEVPAHESMWAIKNALDSINGSTSVVAYTDKGYGYEPAYTLYSSSERVGQQMNFIPCLGGTDPTVALQYANGVLANSTRAIKLLIVITDGEWNPDSLERTEELIRTMRDGGVLTSLAWLEDRGINLDSKNLHGAEIVCHVRNASDLFHLGRSIVEVGIERQLTH
jgi:hypothetical protein